MFTNLSIKAWPIGLALLVLSICAKAEIIPLSLESRVQHAETITLASLKSQESYWDTHHRNIYTLNILEVTAYLKGHSSQSEIGLISLGGMVDGEGQKSFPSVQLQPGKSFVVFLEKDNAEFDHKKIRQSHPQLIQARAYGCTQGVITLEKGRYVDIFGEYPMTEWDLFGKIESLTGEKARYHYGRTFTPRSHGQPSASRSTIATLTKVGGPGGFYAGTINANDVLVITGTGFDQFGIGMGTSTIDFANAYDGGATTIQSPFPATDVISWTDTEIRIKIPDKAGSGMVTVNPQLGTPSSFPITIDWSVVPENNTTQGFAQPTRQRIELMEMNGNGGYTLQFGASMLANSAAYTSFLTALETWRCATFVNLDISAVATTAPQGQNNENQVMFEPPANLPAGVIARATFYYTFSFSNFSPICTQFNTLWRMTEMDIQFNTDVNPVITPPFYSWNFGPALSGGPGSFTYDFESMALKELGRAFGLGYTILPGSVLHFNLAEGVDVRILNGNEVSAGTYKMTHSISPNCIMTPNPMTALTLGSCILEAKAEIPDELSPEKSVFSIYPNPAKDVLNISLPPGTSGPVKVEIYAVDGKQVWEYSLLSEKDKMTYVMNLPYLGGGLYLCTVTTSHDLFSEMIRVMD